MKIEHEFAVARPPDRVWEFYVEEVDQPELRKEGITSGPKQTSPEPDALPGSDGRVNQDSSGENQNETSVAVSPADPLRVVGAWNDYFAVNPGQNTVIGYGWSADGGVSWQSSRVNFATLPSNQSTGDPDLTVDSQGNVYLGILAYSGSANGILVAKSTDGGQTFQEPVRVDNGGDKEYLATDLTNNNVYMVWENGSAVGQATVRRGMPERPLTALARGAGECHASCHLLPGRTGLPGADRVPARAGPEPSGRTVASPEKA